MLSQEGMQAPAAEAIVDRLIPVLLYHGVSADASAGDPLAVSLHQFRSHLGAVAASGRTPLTIGEIARGLRGEAELPSRPVGITFDDADSDTMAAVELLCERGMQASVYVIAGELDTPTGMRPSELASLAARKGVEIGAHSISHPRLDELRGERLGAEVIGSKARLEDAVGEAVVSFAYPYGAYEGRVRSAVVEAGFSSAAAVKNAISHRADDPWAIARWTVRSSTTAAQVTELLEGNGAPLAWSRERLRTKGFRVARRARRRLEGDR